MTFTLLSELGRGGMGVVWRARDEETGQIVALKLLRESYADDPDYLERFTRELELARRVHSAHVVAVLGYGVREGLPYLALEYVDGPSLRVRLAEHGPYTWPETRALLIQLAQGLADAHAAGIVHRDLKPSNVLLAPDGTAKLTDFGVARGVDLTRVTGTSTMLGTPAYLAPEGPVDARSDLYALGVIAYELLTGAPPFEGSTYQAVILAHIRTPPDLARLPAEARPIVGALLAKDPAARPQSAHELLAALHGGASVAPGVPRPAPAPASPPPSTRPPSPRVLAGLGVLALVGLLAAGAFLMGGGAKGTPGPSAAVATGSGGLEASSVAPVNTVTPSLQEPSTPPLPALVWQPTAPLAEARWGQGSVSLQDGRVLVVGGTTSTTSAGAVASAEIYDPASGAWQAAAPLGEPRAYALAVLLADGRVLVAGGSDHEVPLASAEIYSPATNSWSATGPMSMGRTDFAGVRLLDGRVLVVGGGTTTGSGLATNSAEIYAPSTGTWQRVASMHSRRAYCTLSVLTDGRVLVAGGLNSYPSQGTASSMAEIYAPASNTWSPTGPLVEPVYVPTANVLPDGSVLLAGGWNSPAQSAGALALVQRFVPGSGLWTSAPPMLEGRAYARSLTLADGRIVVAGGFSAAGEPLASAELYDPRSQTWTQLPSLSAPEWGGTLALLPHGEVLVAGGSAAADGSSPTRNAELLDLALP